MQSQLAVGKPVVVESAFRGEFDIRKFEELRKDYVFRIFEIHCEADHSALLQRFQGRIESGRRHPGHVEQLQYEELAANLSKDNWGVLNLGGEVLNVATTDFDQVDYEGIVQRIKRCEAGRR